MLASRVRFGIGTLAPLLIAVAALLLVRSAWFADAPRAMAVGVTLDLVLTGPAIFYLLVVRPLRWPPVVVVPVVVAGMLVARWIIPAEHQQALGVIAYAWLAVEALLAAVVVVSVRRLARGYRAGRAAGLSLPDALEQAATPVLHNRAVAGFLAQELWLLGRGLLGWFRRAPAGPGVFAHRDRRTWAALAGVLVFVTLGEGALVHILLRGWSPVAAWILTGLHGYTVILILGDIHAVRLDPVRLHGDALSITAGLRARARVPLARIASATVPDQPVDGALSAAVMGAPNLVIELDGELEVRGPFGLRRRTRRIALAVADPEALRFELGSRRDRES